MIGACTYVPKVGEGLTRHVFGSLNETPATEPREVERLARKLCVACGFHEVVWEQFTAYVTPNQPTTQPKLAKLLSDESVWSNLA